MGRNSLVEQNRTTEMHTYKAYHTLYCSSHELCCLQPALCSKAQTTSTDISCAQSILVAQMMSVTRTFVIFLYLGHCQSYLQMVLAENTSLSLVSLEKPGPFHTVKKGTVLTPDLGEGTIHDQIRTNLSSVYLKGCYSTVFIIQTLLGSPVLNGCITQSGAATCPASPC